MNKCKLKQTFALLAAMTMMSCAAACSGETEAVGEAGGDVLQITAEAAAESESTEVSQEAETATEMKTIEPPQDGWTKEQLNEVMYLMGEPFSLPCKLEEIEKHFIIKERAIQNINDTEWQIDEFDTYHFCSIYLPDYPDEIIGGILYSDISGENIVWYISCFNQKSYDVQIPVLAFNGFASNTDVSQITEILGEKYSLSEDKETYIYDIVSEYNECFKITTYSDSVVIVDYSLYKTK